MSHNENFIGSLHLLVDSLRYNAGTHASCLRRYGRSTTEELICLILNNNSLVAAASQRQVQYIVSVLNQFVQSIAITSNTNTQSRRNLIACTNFAHSIENSKLFFNNFSNCAVSKACQTLFLIHTADKTILFGNPLGNYFVNLAV